MRLRRWNWARTGLGIVLLAALLGPMRAYGDTSGGSTAGPYVIEPDQWGIYNDGTHARETTEGINQALAWAGKEGIKETFLPGGTYLIDKDSRINMVSDMTFELASDAVLQKETNGKERYELLYIGKDVDNVTLKGGTYKGDKDTHDYSRKDNPYSPGTHEGGYGILVEGASNVTVDGVKAVGFTGDGMMIQGVGTLITDYYESGFESGAIDAQGKKIKDSTKIRTSKALNFTNPIFRTENVFELSNMMHLPNSFEVDFYKANGAFLKKVQAKTRDQIAIPEGADHFYLVFNQASAKGAYFEYWNRTVSKNVVVRNSEFAFNRRQGITVGGADNVQITNSVFHDMKGTAPQSGIDVEGGFEVNGFLNRNVTIKDNDFYNNAAYDVILFDGKGATVEGNHLGSKGVIGLAVSDPFTGARVIDNHFDGSRLVAEHDAVFSGNTMNGAYTTISGPNVKIDGMKFVDSTLSVSAKVPFGVDISNVTIDVSHNVDSGFTIWGQPIRVRNLTISGESSLRSITGGSSGGSIFENVSVVGYNANYGLTLPPGTYTGCRFEAGESGQFGPISLTQKGKYVFDGCSFTTNAASAAALVADQPDLDLTIKNSAFELKGNTQAVQVQSAKSFVLENNTITAEHLTSTKTELVKIGDYWKRNEKYAVQKAVITGNTIKTNLAAVGISTIYAGKGAPVYSIVKNILIKARMETKSNDYRGLNQLQS